MAPRKPASPRKPAAKKASEKTADPAVEGNGAETVWLDLHGSGPWHVEVGSAAWERLLGEGAVEIDAPEDAAPAGDTQPPASDEKLVSDMDTDELLAVADLHEFGIDRTLPHDELLAAINQAMQDKGMDPSVPVSQLPTKGD